MSLGLCLAALGLAAFAAAAAPRVEITGDWQVTVPAGTYNVGGKRVRVARATVLDVGPSVLVRVRDEQYNALPPFDSGAAPWTRGARLRGLDTFETTASDMLVPESFILKTAAEKGERFQPGTDYSLEPVWATVGRLPGGAIKEGQPVWADYDYGCGRIDSVLVDLHGAVSLAQGKPHVATPMPPAAPSGSVVLANIWVKGRLASLNPDCLYPIVEPRYPEPAYRKDHPPAEDLLPKTWAKLRAGQPVHVLAWGDSVTAGGQASDDAHRWQSRFVALLQKRFPASQIKLTTSAWGGRNSDSFLAEPPGSPHNFQGTVLDPHPDLIVMEFVNDAYLTPDQVEERYSALLKRFQSIGAEWAILTPHYVRPDWMQQKTARVETDPRPYVAGVRAFAAKHHVALADASLRWGHLLKEGIPYPTLLSNDINHPDDRGHELFALSLMELFGGSAR